MKCRIDLIQPREARVRFPVDAELSFNFFEFHVVNYIEVVTDVWTLLINILMHKKLFVHNFPMSSSHYSNYRIIPETCITWLGVRHLRSVKAWAAVGMGGA